jgi:hypothetical protein
MALESADKPSRETIPFRELSLHAKVDVVLWWIAPLIIIACGLYFVFFEYNAICAKALSDCCPCHIVNITANFTSI